jgi:hypothetical protein
MLKRLILLNMAVLMVLVTMVSATPSQKILTKDQLTKINKSPFQKWTNSQMAKIQAQMALAKIQAQRAKLLQTKGRKGR